MTRQHALWCNRFEMIRNLPVFSISGILLYSRRLVNRHIKDVALDAAQHL